MVIYYAKIIKVKTEQGMYKIIKIDKNVTDSMIEVRFAVASARASSDEILRVELEIDDNEKSRAKRISNLTKILKQLKEEKLIQFFASKNSFSDSSTEAKFLLNKYPELFKSIDIENEAIDFFYIKI